MGKKITAVTASAAGLFLLAGCSAPGEYKGVEEMKDAFVDAGGTCIEWDNHDGTILAEESGSCDGNAALSFFGDNAEGFKTSQETFGMLDIPYIGGENWIIQTDDFDGVEGGKKMAKDLGGELVNESGI